MKSVIVLACPGQEVREITELTAKPKRSTATLIWSIVSQLIALASLGLWVLAVGLSVMAFDAGDSPEARRTVLMVCAYPLFPLVMAIGAWIAFAFRKNWLAAILSGLTFVPAGLLSCSTACRNVGG